MFVLNDCWIVRYICFFIIDTYYLLRTYYHIFPYCYMSHCCHIGFYPLYFPIVVCPIVSIWDSTIGFFPIVVSTIVVIRDSTIVFLYCCLSYCCPLYSLLLSVELLLSWGILPLFSPIVHLIVDPWDYTRGINGIMGDNKAGFSGDSEISTEQQETAL